YLLACCCSLASYPPGAQPGSIRLQLYATSRDSRRQVESAGIYSRSPMTRDPELELLKSICSDLLSRLKEAKLSVDREIGAYPTPIPACDAQFNYLLEQRAKLCHHLDSFRAVREGFTKLDYVALIDDFLRAVAPGDS